ncbi:hypothetical protein MKW98_004915 [Papaver atlanticum]|uniref:Uncharacterized protein n=1 Tax=Papaver atlanticum TaxID=357466 RepID=A0AAD4SGP4_9MAGN|nr:hypothetical protein MKW98_004915 [Papaver atlanticum]
MLWSSGCSGGDMESAVKNASRTVMMIEFVPEKFWGSPLALGLYDTYRKSLLGSVWKQTKGNKSRLAKTNSSLNLEADLN